MGRIKRIAGPKHEATIPPVLSEFVSTIQSIPLAKLPKHLSTFPIKWPFPRGDLYHWIPALDYFDEVLEHIVQEYGLNKGVQTKSFGIQVLLAGLKGESAVNASTVKEIDAEGLGGDGDRQLVEAILVFSRVLMECCGNRSLYSSSERLGDLLNTTSLSLLLTILRLAARLAARYHYARSRQGMTMKDFHSGHLQQYYNLNFHNVQKVLDSSVKFAMSPRVGASESVPDQDTAQSGSSSSPERTIHGNDLFALAISGKLSKQKDIGNWDHIVYDFYETGPSSDETTTEAQGGAQNAVAALPSPIRRNSGHASRARQSSGFGAPISPTQANGVKKDDQTGQNGRQSISISRKELQSQPLETLLESVLPKVAKKSHYDLLNRLRFAKALSESEFTQRQMLAIRILSITNLAYIYPESLFQQQVLQQDSDQPRQLQMVEQLRKLIHDPENGKRGVPLEMKTIALGGLESLLKHKARSSDVISALGVNVSHGMLLHILRQAVADLASDNPESGSPQAEEWREALFSLLEALPSPNSRTAETLVAAGLFEVLVNALKLRTERAERYLSKVLIFLTSITNGVRDAHQTFASNDGLKAIADLVQWEVTSALEQVNAGKGISDDYRSQVMDYQMPFFQQQTLRWLLKYIAGMMHYRNANVDRLLRNLIDSPPLLTGLREIIANAKVFGSNVWSSAINIMTMFIHNEPTSYAVVAEAGLSKALLESVLGKPVDTTQMSEAGPSGNHVCVITQTDDAEAVNVETRPSVKVKPEKTEPVMLSRPADYELAKGILPASDSIINIPPTLGAICLNATGLELFLQSGVLDAFFEVFESPPHAKSLIAMGDYSRMLGASFEELIRHHPRLKPTIMRAVVLMIARVARIGKRRATDQSEGPKLSATVNGPAPGNQDHDEDIVMGELQSSQSTSEASGDPPAEPTATVSVADYVSLVCGFLIGFCENQALCLSLIQTGGLQFLLDLATLPSLPYDFHSSGGNSSLSKILHTLAELKPHLVLPAVLVRAIKTLDELEPLLAHQERTPFFADYLEAHKGKGKAVAKSPDVDGTKMITAMVGIQTLTNILAEAFSHTLFNARSSQTLFNQVNLTDLYKVLIEKLGHLHRACVWEEVMLENVIPESLKESTKVDGEDGVAAETNGALGGSLTPRPPTSQPNGASSATTGAAAGSSAPEPSSNGLKPKPQDSALYQNVKPLRYLLSTIPRQITSFFSSLGRALMIKRRHVDAYQRQNNYAAADALAKALTSILQYPPVKECESPRDRFAYFLVVLTSVSHTLVYGTIERSHSVCCTIVLNAFKQQGGLGLLKGLLHEFFDVVQSTKDADPALYACATAGMKIVLTTFADIVQAKTIAESATAQGMIHNERDKESPYYFSQAQFIIEVRQAVLKAVQPLWGAQLAESANSSITKCLLDILRTILEADQESGAHKRGDNIPVTKEAAPVKFVIDEARMYPSQANGVPRELAYEAAFRTMKSREAADEYLDTRMLDVGLPVISVPENEKVTREETAPAGQPSAPPPTPHAEPEVTEEAAPAEGESVHEEDGSDGSEAHSPSDHSDESDEDHDDHESQEEHHIAEPVEPTEDPQPSTTEPNSAGSAVDADGVDMAMSIDSILNLTEHADFMPEPSPHVAAQETADGAEGLSAPRTPPPIDPKLTQPADAVTVNDLQEARDELRKSLIDTVLDILSVHEDITFDLADLITTAASKASDGATMRKEVGETLVNSLISFQVEDDFRPMGKKIAAYANLLAIIVQHHNFYEATLDELKANFRSLLKFIEIFPDQSADERSPWVGQILLVLEKLLSEDCQPHQIHWIPPPPDGGEPDARQEDPLAEHEPLVGIEDRCDLFAHISHILPRVGKDQSLALSVVRILVILTRDRLIAERLGEKRPLQGLFLMAKQLAGASDERFQKAFLLVLRHIIEDDATVRAYMRAELVAFFASSGRGQDPSAMVRSLAHLVLRSPTIFLEVVQEKLKLQRFDPSSRHQNLYLKDGEAEQANAQGGTGSDKASPQAGDAAEGSVSPIKPSTEGPASAESTDEQMKAMDVKTPMVENPDGVIHFLLSELLAYGNVEDKDVEAPKDLPPTAPSGSPGASGQPTPSQETNSGSNAGEEKKVGKPEYKPEEHPIYNYRCFLLQCLTELLMSYTRAKIEFINFSRKADPKVMTPSKPRSGVLNYLLNALVPIGSLDRPDTIAIKKKYGVSQWAMCAIVALCLKPGPPPKDTDDEDEKDSDLLFVRKFVLENLLKTFKDAHAATEPLEQKYSRLMSLADLFYRLLLGRVHPNISAYTSEQTSTTHREIARVMFEKSFIAALTTAVADIDLNFPSAKRAVKYILRPLKILTDTGVYLSQNSDLSTVPGQTEDDEISTASSVSDVNDGREETPDLFRNSTLGILEPGREEDVSSDGSDEDEDMLDEDEYDEGPEYDDGVDADDDEVVSEEEMGDAGPVEGLPGDVGMDVEVVIDDEGDDDDDDDDGSTDSDDMDGDEDMDAMEEINGDDENDSLNGGDIGEWQDEDDDEGGEDGDDGEEDDMEENENEDEELIDGHGPPPPDPAAARALMDFELGLSNTLPPEVGDLAMDVENGRYMVGDLIQREMDAEGNPYDDEDVEDEDEEDVEPVTYEPDYDDDDDGGADAPPWGWDMDEEDAAAGGRPHAHHTHVRRLGGNPWSVFPHGADGGALVRESGYRSHRTTRPRGSDDGVNPLLQRNDTPNSPRRGLPPPIGPGFGPGLGDWMHMLHPNRGGTDHSAVSFISNIMSAIQRGVIDHHTGTLRVRLPHNAPQPPPYLTFDDDFHQLMSRHHRHHHHHSHDPTRPVREDSSLVPLFYPTGTAKRWHEEAQLLFGTNFGDKPQRVINSILALLVPPALEEEKIRREQEAKAAEERRKQEEEERAQEAERLAKEKEERDAQEQKEREEREAAEREAAEQHAREQPNAEAAAPEGEPMEGVEAAGDAEPVADAPAAEQENAEAGPSNAEAGPSEPQERVRATIRGREVDITGMGIDLEYLNALPEEFREEVLMQQVAEQRSQAHNAGEQPTEITREFLDALPADIREEIMQQEAQDRRRREREEAHRQAAANNGEATTSAQAEDMDPASFFASLDPVLRSAVLMDQDEDMLAQLPANLRAEAQALGLEHGRARWPGDPGRIHRSNAQRHAQGQSQSRAEKKKPKRQVVQMVDKSGVATLLRLLFVQQNSAKDIFHKILENISQNRQNRAEVMTLLLSILQEGSADVNAVERSFIQLTSRAKQPTSQKAPPQTPKRGASGSTSSPLNSEMTPLMVMQQCLSVLVHLTGHNIHVPSYFLTEHELSTTLRGKSAKKGKAKENRAAKFPLNALLSLLDRKMIVESAGCMEQLCTLLRSITYPLTILRKKDKEKAEGESTDKPKEESAGQTGDAQPTIEGETQGGSAEAAGTTSEAVAGGDPANNQNAPTTSEVAPPAEGSEIKKEDEKDEAKEEKPKKQRTLVPPVIPEYNLRLVVGILAARDCSSKTFRDTLSTIDNLSSIPSTRPIFGLELIKQAQSLGDQISTALDELIPQLQKAESNTEAQSAALAKFQPSSSDQAKLLRVLTALDYLFDPERNAKSGDEDAQEEISKDYLTNLYENATFGPLWSKLSECLSSVRQKDHASTLNVATILLPLVESLMVVCKNTTLKDQGLVKESKEFAVTSPQPESGMENLFFRFTEDHRKVLNNLVRHNPRLMSGTFSLLVRNPKVLEFDNKRNYFTRQLHARTEAKPPQPPLQISVRRDQAFLDSYSKLHYRSPDEIKFGKLSVRFSGEEGVDAGGVTREWFQVMSRQMFNPDYVLFTPVASDRTTFHPNKVSEINPEHLAFFKFIGRIIGKALYEGRALDCHFSRAVYKRILGRTVSIKDMETLDLDYYKSLLWMLENDISDIITETFSVEAERFGATQVIDLIENGRNIPVTEENKQEYVQLVVEYRLTGSVHEQLEEFLKGFHDIVPAKLIAIFNEQELELLISGLPDIDVDDWKNHSDYHNYTAASAQIQWFWRAVRSFDKEERAKLLQFVTGTSKVPLNGFKELEGMNGFSRFNIHRDYGNKDRLPSSHTCFNQLDLPEYDDYEALRKQLHTAMTAGSEYFGFA